MIPAASSFAGVLRLLSLTVGVLGATASDAWAYVDPGTGSYVFQLAVAGVLGTVYAMRTYLHALVNVIRGRCARTDASASAPPRPDAMD